MNKTFRLSDIILLSVLVFLCIGFTTSFQAQEIPPISVFSDSDYDAESQNWAISQDSNRLIYVANNNGLLQFNGSNWHLYPSPNKTIIRSVNVIQDRIYTGCYMEFGFWEHNELGQLIYTSLSNKIKDQLIEDEQFWTIINVDNWILFQSLNRIYCYDLLNESFNIIESDTKVTKMFKVDDNIYFQKLFDGIFKIENGKDKLIIDDEIVKDNIVINILEHNDMFLIQTQEKGIFNWNDNQLTPWNSSLNSFLNNVSIYSSLKLSDGRLALGTIANGILFLKENGDLDFSINQSLGLSNNTVLSIFEDKENNIWLGLDKGINCINLKSPFTIFVDNKGTLGTVYTSILHEGNLYLGTNQGLFYRRFNSNQDFKFIEGTKGQVWCLVNYKDQLFCGHNDGTFIVNGDKVNKVVDIPGTWNLKPINEYLLQGNYDGLYLLEEDNESWKLKHKLEGFDISSKHYDFLNDTTLFVNHEYKGVFKLKLNKALTKVVEVINDTSVDKGLNSSLAKFNNELLYAYNEGIFKYDNTNNKFVKDSTLSQLYDKESFISGQLIMDSDKSRLWSFSKNEISYVTQGQLSNSLKINKLSLPHATSKMMVGYENIFHINKDVYLLGTSTGYIIVDLDKLIDKDFDISINSIFNYGRNSEKQFVNRLEDQSFENKLNNFEFEFSVTTFDKFSVPEYQYQLKGLYDNWSDWSTESSVLFENLPYGNYTFNVKAKCGNVLSKNQDRYQFTIKKPWYLSATMTTAYIIGFLLLSVLIHSVYKTYYKKQKQKLVEKNKRDLELKELANQQQLMKLNNEKLQQDIENKNRELAISTMSLIKKNEFLSNIKEELKSVDSSDSEIKPIIKIIDKNLNNTDDWKFFQEAFNNADKGFLKKVKAKHPSLTPNDLKLCAYLRLNLSSKEIAPLLNISPKSVEVKRYRLRKKMELPHESSLTNYILEI